MFAIPTLTYVPSTATTAMTSNSTDIGDDTDSASGISERTAPESDVHSAVGLSNAQLSPQRRRMLDSVNHLLDTGVQLDIDVPLIAVIGNQSAGKSSLIEAISGITLPRASGTCTRCPTVCRLKNSNEPWRCKVSLNILTDRSGQTLGQPEIKVFGDVIFRKEDVEERIRRAQRAILNPHIPPQRFLDNDEDAIGNLKASSFSMNCVALEIVGRDVADLSFVDLPGLIRSTSDGNTGDIELVERMVESYIKKPSCIILLTVSCETDFMNQGALQLAKKFDGSGERTVGVLTKPDRIERGDEQEWLGFIRGETQPLQNNWFCVKQPSTADLLKGITWAEARDKENRFFSMTSPWCDMEAMYQKYLRTSNLVERLSVILSDLIAKRLPEIQGELENAILEVRNSLQALPKEPSNDPVRDITNMIYNFVDDVKKHMEGVPTRDGLLQNIRPHQERFRLAIRNTAPNFKPFERSRDLKSSPSARPDFIIQEEGDLVSDDLEDSDPIYADEVLRTAEGARTRELPSNHPYVVKETYVSAITQRWLTPAERLCKEVFDLTSHQVGELIAKHFAEFGQAILERQVKRVVHEYIRMRYEHTQKQLEWFVKLEARPSTLNTHYFTDYRDKFLGFYKGQRMQELHPDLMYDCLMDGASLKIQDAVSVLTGLGIDPKPVDLLRLLPPDEMEPALKIMAEVRAYFQVAYKRFVDMVPLTIDYELIRGLDRDILTTLLSGLRIHSEDGPRICREFAHESPQLAGRREELSKKMERLLSASQELSKL
uniref:P-loop containing nucleoside triphosphate hydrolase protein n=1 Tax=Moniliophthora roreri TaxID=221103 RepID=A0A0W0FU61_MONRR